jgi:hypothetical protein
MKKLNEIFDVAYGSKLDLNKMVYLETSAGGINFVGRSSKNHGVSAIVAPLPEVMPYEAGLITVALGGTKLLSSFIQEKPFYTAQNVAVLRPKEPMTFAEKLFICLSIRHNRFRYCAFGREANRTLRDLLVPEKEEFPDWIRNQKPEAIDAISHPAILTKEMPDLAAESQTDNWQPFEFQFLFEIERGRGPRRKDLDGNGSTPFVSSSDSNNGVTGITSIPACHKGNTIGVNRNGSVGEAFYQSLPFCSTEDVHIFNPKFPLNPYIGLFLTTLIRREKYRFGYGRKWGIERMKRSTIHLPVKTDGTPDWDFMEQYIKSLPYSSQIA